MPLIDESKINISLKKILGKAHTDNSKAPGNELYGSGVTVAGSTVFGKAIPTVPTTTNLYDITDGSVELVRLVAVPDPSANGHAFLLELPSDYETGSSNPKAGTGSFVNGQRLATTAGSLQIVPAVYSPNAEYEPKPYTGGTSTKGSGSLVPPGDVRDWTIDVFNGIIFQENDPDTGPADITYVECFIYIGDMITDVVSGGLDNIPLAEGGNSAVTGTELIDSVAIVDAKTVDWMTNVSDGSNTYSSHISASTDGTLVGHDEFAIRTLGSPSANLAQFDVAVNGTNLELNMTTDGTDVVVNITRILVR